MSPARDTRLKSVSHYALEIEELRDKEIAN